MSAPNPNPNQLLRSTSSPQPPPGDGLRIWIDATRESAGLRVFGMTLLERLLRALIDAGVRPSDVQIDLAPGRSAPALRRDVGRRLPLRFVAEGGSCAERLARAAQAAGGMPLLAFEADAVVDARLIRHLAASREDVAARGEGEGAWGRPAAALRLHGALALPTPEGDGLRGLADAAIARGLGKELGGGEIDDYIPRQRRHLPPYLFGLRDATSVREAERFLFWSTYKGSTDFFTRYVYPPLVWLALKPLTRWRLHPNWITGFNILITLGALPLFAEGRWIAGLVLSYTMSVLDSVDGKLARLSFRSSELGHNLDHGLDFVHPPLWYAAWAWALGGGVATSLIFQSSLFMAAVYFLDRLLIRLFTWRTGRSIHAFTPLDVRARTVISRRNINLPLFTVGLMLGLATESFWLIVGWQVATFVFHGVRLGQCWNARGARRSAAVAPA